MKKSTAGLLIVSFVLLLIMVSLVHSHLNFGHTVNGPARNITPFPNDGRTRKIFDQEHLIAEGDRLVKKGQFDAAIAKYREATKPELLLHDYDEDGPTLMMAKALEFQSKYEDAISCINKILKKYPNVHAYDESWDGKKLELEALIKARDSNSSQPVYEHIKYLREKYKDVLPPNNCLAGICDIVASGIIRLYDHIGDFDGGVAFMDEFVNYYAKRWRIAPESIGGKNQYFQIKQAFLQSKADGFKGCLTAKPGEVCMGRATKAIIESKYFSW